MERSLTHRHSRNRSYLFFSGWLACENHWNLRVVSPTPHLYPQQKCPLLIQKLKKKKCVCVCIYIYIYMCVYIYIYIYIYIWTTQEQITCIYFNSDCTFDFVSGLYHIPKIVGKLLFTLRTVFIWEEIQLVWVGNNTRKLKYIFWKDD